MTLMSDFGTNGGPPGVVPFSTYLVRRGINMEHQRVVDLLKLGLDEETLYERIMEGKAEVGR
jgi:hypothetical protein